MASGKWQVKKEEERIMKITTVVEGTLKRGRQVEMRGEVRAANGYSGDGRRWRRMDEVEDRRRRLSRQWRWVSRVFRGLLSRGRRLGGMWGIQQSHLYTHGAQIALALDVLVGPCVRGERNPSRTAGCRARHSILDLVFWTQCAGHCVPEVRTALRMSG